MPSHPTYLDTSAPLDVFVADILRRALVPLDTTSISAVLALEHHAALNLALATLILTGHTVATGVVDPDGPDTTVLDPDRYVFAVVEPQG